MSQVGCQNAPERAAQRGMLQPERDIGFEIAELVAAIKAPGDGAQTVEQSTIGDQPVEPVGQRISLPLPGFNSARRPKISGWIM